MIDHRPGEELPQSIDEGWRQSTEVSAALFDDSPVAKWICDLETRRIRAVNESALELFGYTREEVLPMTVDRLFRGEGAFRVGEVLSGRAPGVVKHGKWRLARKDGAFVDAELTTHTFVLDGRETKLFVLEDISGQLALQGQLQQARKMETIGRFMGGIAHDFNNLLAVILSYSEGFLDELEPAHGMRPDMEDLHGAARRAAELTRQLLAFSRRPMVTTGNANLNETVTGMDKLLRRLISENIDLATVLAPSAGEVGLPGSQLEQIIMNLVLNARDAMPTGGRVTIETAMVNLGRSDLAGRPGAVEGPNIVLSVTDTGVGMASDTVARIFEPFFTTKGPGQGTGLGLSTVLEIVRENGGTIGVESTLGSGTSIRIHFPVGRARVDGARQPQPDRDPFRGRETVLLVEEEACVRALVGTVLTRHGYDVLLARSGTEAVGMLAQHRDSIDLVLSDVVMPGMSGAELASRLTNEHPEIPILFMSGDGEPGATRGSVRAPNLPVLQKPLTRTGLLKRVREVLDRPARRVA